MERLEYTVTFHTPAFLGNDKRSGQWRTPPFKALLRQWWRVAYAAEHKFDVDVQEMRRDEALLFGHAWLENDRLNGHRIAARKSLVRLRLERWMEGELKKQQWPRDEIINHPEVNHRIGSALYLGYGPLRNDDKKTILYVNAAIQAGEKANLSIAVPEKDRSLIDRALWLMDRYGTLGGRSRNGWGSFTLAPINTPLDPWKVPTRNWKHALNLDWPHAIGQDEEGALIWQTKKTYDDWRTLLRDLAIIKIGLRTQFVFTNTEEVEPRLWLAYPAGKNHATKAFPNNARLPNSLRFKVRRTGDGKLVGVIFHMPCLPPPDFKPKQHAIETTWKTVHRLLDELTKPSGRTYSMVTNTERRDRLAPELDKVTLKRIAE